MESRTTKPPSMQKLLARHPNNLSRLHVKNLHFWSLASFGNQHPFAMLADTSTSVGTLWHEWTVATCKKAGCDDVYLDLALLKIILDDLYVLCARTCHTLAHCFHVDCTWLNKKNLRTWMCFLMFSAFMHPQFVHPYLVLYGPSFQLEYSNSWRFSPKLTLLIYLNI